MSLTLAAIRRVRTRASDVLFLPAVTEDAEPIFNNIEIYPQIQQ